MFMANNNRTILAKFATNFNDQQMPMGEGPNTDNQTKIYFSNDFEYI